MADRGRSWWRKSSVGNPVHPVSKLGALDWTLPRNPPGGRVGVRIPDRNLRVGTLDRIRGKGKFSKPVILLAGEVARPAGLEPATF